MYAGIVLHGVSMVPTGVGLYKTYVLMAIHKMPNRVRAGLSPALPTPPCMRLRYRAVHQLWWMTPSHLSKSIGQSISGTVYSTQR